MAERREEPQPERKKGCGLGGCLGGLLFFALGTGMIFVAFALGRAWEKRDPDASHITIEELKQSLYDTEADIRRRAAEKLGLRGDEAGAAAKDLGKLLSDQSAEVRKAAAEALEKIGPAAEEALPQLREALHDASEEVREAARRALEKIRGEQGEGKATENDPEKKKEPPDGQQPNPEDPKTKDPVEQEAKATDP